MMKLLKLVAGQKEYAQQYQLNGLLTGEETPPQRLAEFVAFLLQSKEHHKIFNWFVFTIWSMT